jgi:hypothetical protein
VTISDVADPACLQPKLSFHTTLTWWPTASGFTDRDSDSLPDSVAPRAARPLAFITSPSAGALDRALSLRNDPPIKPPLAPVSGTSANLLKLDP